MKKKVFKNLIYLIILIISIVVFIKMPIIRELIKLLFICFILAYVLKPIKEFIMKFGLNHKTAAFLLIIFFVFLFVFSIVVFIPAIIKESSRILSFIDEINEFLSSFTDKFKIIRENNYLRETLSEFNNKANEFIISTIEGVLNNLGNAGGNIVNYLAMPIILYYFLSEGEKIGNRILVLFSCDRRNMIKKILLDIDKVMSKYILSQLLLCAIIGIFSFIGLKILNVQFPILLSIINGILNIVPYFGPPIGVILTLMVSLLDSSNWVWVLLWLLLTQGLESNIISPMIIGHSVNMHPLLVIILLILGGEIGGFLGMILAIPLGVVLKIVYDDINYYAY